MGTILGLISEVEKVLRMMSPGIYIYTEETQSSSEETIG